MTRPTQSQSFGYGDAKLAELERRLAAVERWTIPSILSVNDSTLTLLNGWAQGDATNHPVRALIYGDGRCYLQGRLLETNATSTTVMYLGDDFKPQYNINQPLYRDADATIDNIYGIVLTTGEVRVYVNAAGTANVDLDALQWVAGQ